MAMPAVVKSRRDAPMSRWRVLFWQVLVLAAALALWTLAITTNVLSPRIFATPWDAARWLAEGALSGQVWTHILATLQAALLGTAVGLLAGAIVAGTFVFVPLVADVFNPFMALFAGVPKVVVAPVVVMIVGLGMGSKVVIAAAMVFFIAFFNLYSGLDSVDRNLVANLRILGASRRHLLVDLYLPAVLTWIFATLRVSVGLGFTGTIVGEFVGSTKGVGWLISIGTAQLQAQQVFGGLLALAILALAINSILSRVERPFAARNLF